MKKLFEASLKITFIILAIVFYYPDVNGIESQKEILITDFGYEPGSRKNVIPAVKRAIEQCRNAKEDITIVFSNGRYDFWQDFSERSTIGIQMRNLKNVTIEGNGSEFIFHGNMQIARIFECENVTLRNFIVDWDRPFIYQGRYLISTDEYIEIEFDFDEYPYLIEDSLFYLTGEGLKARPNVVYNTLYDRDSREILYNTHDGNNSELISGKAEEIRPGIVRFYGTPNIKPPTGTYTTLFAGRYITTGIHISESKNTYLKDLTIYHALSNVILGSRSENITMDNVNVRANEKKYRVFSSIADASHFNNCKGLIKVINCAHTGQGDDFINVRGAYIKIESIYDENSITTIRDPANNRQGDEIWFVNPKHSQRSEARTIKSKEPIIQDGNRQGTKITFTELLPHGVQTGDYMENKTWSPSVEIRNNRILKNNRARGILVTTPYQVVIEDNYFRTAGTAILIEGDMDYWFESGAHRDVSIRNNIFEDCLTSGSITGNRWEWGEAIITITPSHYPENERTEPYHKNIKIANNTFKTFDIPLVHARSVRGIDFIDNEIIRTYTYKPYAWQKSSFLLDGCREVSILGNRISEDYLTRTIEIDNMRRSDVRSEGFSLILK